jgi:hypothetical protein
MTRSRHALDRPSRRRGTRACSRYHQQDDVIDAAVSDENFEFGLAAVLAGLEARVT